MQTTKAENHLKCDFSDIEKGNLLRLPFFEPFTIQNLILWMEAECYFSLEK